MYTVKIINPTKKNEFLQYQVQVYKQLMTTTKTKQGGKLHTYRLYSIRKQSPKLQLLLCYDNNNLNCLRHRFDNMIARKALSICLHYGF